MLRLSSLAPTVPGAGHVSVRRASTWDERREKKSLLSLDYFDITRNLDAFTFHLIVNTARDAHFLIEHRFSILTLKTAHSFARLWNVKFRHACLIWSRIFCTGSGYKIVSCKCWSTVSSQLTFLRETLITSSLNSCLLNPKKHKLI